MKSKPTRTGREGATSQAGSLGFALLLLATTAAVPACADKVVPKSSPCPCAGSNVCCTSGVCAKDEASCGQATLALAQESAGTWSGYFENFTLSSGSDALHFSLAVSGQTTTGQLVLGDAPAPPPPTDVHAPWPPGWSDGGIGIDAGYVEGFVYEARDIRWESRRLRFKVALGDAWQTFCSLYTPNTVGGATFICPAGGWDYNISTGCRALVVPNPSPSDSFPIDCSLLAPCNSDHRPCDCGVTSCTANAGELDIDVALRGDIGDGSSAGTIGANVRLIRSSQ